MKQSNPITMQQILKSISFNHNETTCSNTNKSNQYTDFTKLNILRIDKQMQQAITHWNRHLQYQSRQFRQTTKRQMYVSKLQPLRSHQTGQTTDHIISTNTTPSYIQGVVHTPIWPMLYRFNPDLHPFICCHRRASSIWVSTESVL